MSVRPQFMYHPYWRTAGYFGVLAIIGMTNSMIGPTLAALAARSHSSLSAIADLFIARSLGAIVGSMIGGGLLARFSGHRVLLGALAVFFTAHVSVPLCDQRILLLGLFFFMAVGELASDVAVNTLTAWTYGDKAPNMINLLHLCFGIGSFCAPWIVILVLPTAGGAITGYWVLAALILCVSPVFVLLRSPPEPQRTVTQGQAVRPINVALGAAFLFLYVGAESGIGNWLVVYVQQRGLGADADANRWLVAFWASIAAGRLLFAPLMTRIGTHRILIGNGITAVAMTWYWTLTPPTAVTMMVMAISTGLAISCLFPAMIGFADARMRLSGPLAGFFFAGASLGLMVLPWLIGRLIEPFGPQVVFYVVATGFTLALLVAALLLYRLRESPC